MLSLCIEI
eukprot:gene21120-27366_t